MMECVFQFSHFSREIGNIWIIKVLVDEYKVDQKKSKITEWIILKSEK
jgi:hypothetical protein